MCEKRNDGIDVAKCAYYNKYKICASRKRGVINMIGQRIRKFRIKNGFNQTELGAKVSKPTDVICKIERGTRRVAGDEVVIFAAALGVTAAELLDEDQAPTGTDK